jgi:replicative DNA helicase
MKDLNEYSAIVTCFRKQSFMQKLVMLPVEVFQNYKNQVVMQAIKDLAEDNEIIDLPMVLSHLQTIGKTPDNSYVEALLKTDPSLNPDKILKQLEQRYDNSLILRSVEEMKHKIIKGELDDTVQLAEEIMNIAMNKKDGTSIEFSEYALSSMDDIFPDNYYTPTGLKALDDAIIGVSDGQFITVASEPGGGKTSLMWQIAKDKNSSFFSLEMDRSELYAKHLSAEAEVDIGLIESKNLTDDQFKRVTKAHVEAPEYFKGNVKVYDDTYNIFSIVNKIKEDAILHDKKWFFIDYFQLLEGPKLNNQIQTYDFMSRLLKQTARKLKVKICVAAQFNKEGLKSGRPTSAHLYGTGSLHKDCDLILINWFNEGILTVSVDKGRKCKKGDIAGIIFEGQFQRFKSIAYNPKPYVQYTPNY